MYMEYMDEYMASTPYECMDEWGNLIIQNFFPEKKIMAT